MKKKLLILAVAAVALASCSNDETVAVNQSDAISFRPVMTNVTRAADQTATTLESNGFYVSARTSTDAEFFTDVAFTTFTDGTPKTWTSATKYYWPGDNSTLTFYAYAPQATGDGHNAQITAHSSYKSFSVTPSATIADQVDLIFAEASANKTSGASGVQLNFRHSGSKIVFKLKNNQSTSNLKVTVNSVTIGNVKNSGVFTYTGQTSSKLKQTDWDVSAASSATPYTTTVSSEEATQTAINTDAGQVVGTEMILIPQVLSVATAYNGNNLYSAEPATAASTFDGAYISVELKIQDATTNAYIYGDADNFKTAMWPLTALTWAPGYKYTYTIDLAGGGYYPVNTTGDSALDPILDGSEIKFISVTVDDWADGGAGGVYTGS